MIPKLGVEPLEITTQLLFLYSPSIKCIYLAPKLNGLTEDKIKECSTESKALGREESHHLQSVQYIQLCPLQFLCYCEFAWPVGRWDAKI